MKEYKETHQKGVITKENDFVFPIDRDFWLEPQEAIEYGLADMIMTPGVLEEWLDDK